MRVYCICRSITKSASLYSIFISSALVHYLTILCKHLYYFQVGGKQSDFLFSIFHLSSSVLTTVLDTKQAIPDCPAIHESMPLAGCPENTRPACTPGTSRTNQSLSSSGCSGPHPNLNSKPPLLSPGLSVVQGPPPSPLPIS